MKILRITNIKDFMNKLLLSEMFDHFLLVEASISQAATFIIDGHLTNDFFSEEEIDAYRLNGLSYAPFSLLRAGCYDMIKGKKTPVSFKFVFMLSPDNLARTLAKSDGSFAAEDLNGVFINLKFQGGSLTCTTGVSYKTFLPDHSFEQYWDSLVPKFLSSHEISYDIA